MGWPRPGSPHYRPPRGAGHGGQANGAGAGGPASSFDPGHELSLRHGAYSPRKVDPLARELVEQVAAQVPYLAADPSYAPAVWAWARAEAQVQLLDEYLQEMGSIDGDVPRPLLETFRHFMRLAADARSRLGLDPMSRAKLGRDVTSASVDLAALMAEANGRVRADVVDVDDQEDGET